MQLRCGRQCMTFFKVLVYQLTGEIKATIVQFYVEWLSVIDIKRKWRLLEIQELDSLQRLGLFEIRSLLSVSAGYTFRSPSRQYTSQQNKHIDYQIKMLHPKLFSDKRFQLLAVFYIHSASSYPSQNTKVSLFTGVSLPFKVVLD